VKIKVIWLPIIVFIPNEEDVNEGEAWAQWRAVVDSKAQYDLWSAHSS
jgi:hypothetical protein